MPIDYLRRTDSDGVAHFIDVQDQPMSCFLAAVGMALRQMMAHGRHARPVSQTEETMLTLYSMLSPGSLFNSQLRGQGAVQTNGAYAGTHAGFGTWANNVTPTLRRLGVRVTHHDIFDPRSAHDRFHWRRPSITPLRPAIVMLGWYNREHHHLARHGGHFVVASRIAKNGNVVLLDPAPPFGGLYESAHDSPVYRDSGRFEQVFYLD